MTLGEKLYGLRKKRGLSQEQLAECLNVSRQSISKWEGDITYPEAEKLVALSEYFQVSLDYLMKADMTDEAVQERVQETVREDSKSAEKKQEPLLAGLTICIGAVIGLVFIGLLSVFFPKTADQTAASSMITLNGTALLVLLFIGLLIIGVALIIRVIRRK